MGTIFNMEQAAFATESMNDTVVMVDAMKHANKEMRKQFKQIDIDGIDVSFSLSHSSFGRWSQ